MPAGYRHASGFQRRQLAEIERKPCLERGYIGGAPICPESPERLEGSWQHHIIRFRP